MWIAMWIENEFRLTFLGVLSKILLYNLNGLLCQKQKNV